MNHASGTVPGNGAIADRDRMYLPSWPGLDPRFLMQKETAIPRLFPFTVRARTYAFVARSLIYHLFRELGFQDGSTVLVPDYHHGNEVRAIRASGASIVWYRVGRDFQIDPDEVERLCAAGPRALFVIHYLGWPQPMDEIGEICRRHRVLLIEDCALSLLSRLEDRPLGSFGDYAVFCLYKTLPVPNGALLVQNRRLLPGLESLSMQPCGMTSLAGRCLDLSLDWMRSRDLPAGALLSLGKSAVGRAMSAAGIRRVPVGDIGFDTKHLSVGMSPISKRLLAGFDYGRIFQRRRDNYLLLRESLSGVATLPPVDLEKGICPLFFPILVPDKARAARALWDVGIGAIEFWNEGDPEAALEGGADALYLRKHLLELPIHQEVTERQIRYMADQIIRLRLHF